MPESFREISDRTADEKLAAKLFFIDPCKCEDETLPGNSNSAWLNIDMIRLIDMDNFFDRTDYKGRKCEELFVELDLV